MSSAGDHHHWAIPVPLRPAAFAPLHRRHAGLALEVDLGAIGAFFAPRARRVGWADFQLLPDGVSRGRLGAGRAVHFAGHYLKGVGRTPLAANWHLREDRRHATGHLFASAAVREYLVSRYAESRGLGDAIVPCTGVLLRARPRGVALGAPPGPVPAIDRALQAISIKPGGFARLSNFSWALHQLEASHATIADLTLAFERQLATAPVDPRACTPRSMMQALAAAIDRTLSNLDRYLTAGVHWGYIDNNLTADGRFLDLEVPAVIGGPALGVLQTEAAPLRASDRWVGLDALDFARRARIFVEDLASRLHFLATSCALQHRAARQFAAALATELALAIPRGHVIRSPRALIARTTAQLTRTLALGAAGRRALREVVIARHAYVEEQRDAAIGGEVRAVPLRLAIHTPGVQRTLRQPAWAPPPSDDALARATRYNDVVMRVDRARTIDDALAELAAAGAIVRA